MAEEGKSSKKQKLPKLPKVDKTKVDKFSKGGNTYRNLKPTTALHKTMNMGEYTHERFERICERIATSKDSMKTICEEEGTTYTSFKRWLIKDDGLPETERKNLGAQYARAKEEQADYLAELMIEVAFEDQDDEKAFVGTNHIQRDRLKVDTLKFIASKLKPKKYGDKVDLTSGGEKIKEVNLSEIVRNFMTNEGDEKAEESV